MFEIEKATAVDAPQIAACVEAAYQHYIARMGMPPGPMLDDYGDMISDHHVWVVKDNGRVIALLVLIDKPDMMLLDNVAVHPDYQGKRLGKKLVSFAEDQAKQRGYLAIQLYTHELMTENQAIYTKMGYAEFTRKREKGFDRVYMKKAIA